MKRVKIDDGESKWMKLNALSSKKLQFCDAQWPDNRYVSSLEKQIDKD